jgi:chitin synthase
VFQQLKKTSAGLKTPDRQRAWREKIGLLGVVAALMAAVGFLTFGFTQAVCNHAPLTFHWSSVQSGSMVFNGYDYSMDRFAHPDVPGVGGGSNPLYSDWNAGGRDGSFMFQNVNQHCKGIITPAAGTGIPVSGDNMGWYFPCNIFSLDGSSPVNKTGYTQGQLCHTQADARQEFSQASSGQTVIGMKREGQVFYTWDDIANSSRNLGVYQTYVLPQPGYVVVVLLISLPFPLFSSVLDFSLFKWLDKSQVSYPAFFDELAAGNSTYRGVDATMQIMKESQRELADCMADIIRVGFVEGKTIGCIIADIVLYVSLIFIIGVVTIKFGMAVLFGWILSWRLGSFGTQETTEERARRAAEIEAWTADIYRPAPAKYRPNAYATKKPKSYLPTKSRFTHQPQKSVTAFPVDRTASRPVSTAFPSMGDRRSTVASFYGGQHSPQLKGSRSSASLYAPSVQVCHVFVCLA